MKNKNQDPVMRLFTLLNLDEEFARTPGAKVINSESLVSKKLSKDFTDAIYSNSDGELGFVPSCQCGATRGAAHKGLTCPQCGTVCDSQFTDTLMHTTWLGLPDHMAPVLHPVWFAILKDWTSISKKSKSSIIELLLNPEDDLPEDLVPLLPPGRGFQYFYDNADTILDVLLNKYETAFKPKAASVRIFRKYYRDCMFTRHLPILHNSLHPLKSNGGTLRYVDATSKEILSAVIDLSVETFREHSTTVSIKQSNRVLYGIYMTVFNYYQAIIKEKIGGKKAILRKHDFGSRIHFSARTVIVPHDHVLPMDEVVMPWDIMVNGLKLPIMNFLMNKYKLHCFEALSTVMRALNQYDPMVDKCISQIVDEYPSHRIPIGLGRNPEN